MYLVDKIAKILNKYDLDDYTIGGDSEITEITIEHYPITLELLEEINLVAAIDEITIKNGFIHLTHVRRKDE
jgi:hypothetical protein